MASQLGSTTKTTASDDEEEEDDGLGTDDDDDDTGAPVNPIRSREVREAVEGDVTEAARKQGGWVGKRKRNTGRKGGGWLSETPRVVDDERTGPGGFEPTSEPTRNLHAPPPHLRRGPLPVPQAAIRRDEALQVSHGHDDPRGVLSGLDELSRVEVRLGEETPAPRPRVRNIACTNRVCPHVKFLLHHRRECADGDGCYVCAAAREREKMEFTVIGDDDDDDEERAKKRKRKIGRGGGRGRGRGMPQLRPARRTGPLVARGDRRSRRSVARGVRFRKELPVDGP